MKVYLNTNENLFLDQMGQMFRDGLPRLIVGGHETFEIMMKTNTLDYGSEGANPDSWPVDSSWSEIDGISALLTLDSDYILQIAGKLLEETPAGSLTVSASLANTEDIPLSGTIRIYAANDSYEDVAYSQREISGSNVTFILGTALVGSYPADSSLDCRQSPLASCFLNAADSDWESGKLVFDLAVDSLRLRRETAYSNSATIAIPGMELLLFHTTADNITRKIKAFIWDSVSLWKTQGDPGSTAPAPDDAKNYIAAEIQRQLQNLAPGGGGGSTNASDIIISAESEFYAGMDVAAALQMIGAELDGLEAELEGI